MNNTIESRLAELGITLPEAPAPAANYVPWLIEGGQLFISGQIPMADGKVAFAGKVGAEVDVAHGQAAARLCAINILAQAKAALGDLTRIRQLLRVTGYVNAAPDFEAHPMVINGASDLLADVLGEAGRHTRAAVGAGSLPLGVSVEVDALFAVNPA